MDISILIPCLNESRTLVRCIEKAKLGIASTGLRGEIIIADNDSTDGSATLAKEHGATVIVVKERGYGNALRAGLQKTQGTYIVMGDGDESYDFSAIKPFIEKLKEGYDVVIGNRFSGKIEPGAMLFLNRYLGNPGLSMLGKVLYGNVCGDFHCGLRALKRSALADLNLRSTGMEFASEMIISAALKNMRIGEVPITLYRDGRGRQSHLRRWRDGFRHIQLMVKYKFQ